MVTVEKPWKLCCQDGRPGSGHNFFLKCRLDTFSYYSIVHLEFDKVLSFISEFAWIDEPA